MIDALLARLESDADAEIARILEDGHARAVELTAASDRRIAERRAATLEQREGHARAAQERVLAGCRREARARVMESRAALLERVFAQLRASLPALARSRTYRSSLAARVGRVRAYTGPDPVTIECAPSLAVELRRVVKANGRLRITDDPRITAGFRVTSLDGRVQIDAQLDNRLEQLRPRLALEALAALGV